jgi:CheY-like chemotaxis protein
MLKTLVVDDNEEFRQTLVEILYKCYPTIKIVEAVSGKEAREKAKILIPNFVFMDIRLPDENGLDVSKHLKYCYPDIDIVVMSSFNLPEYRNAATRLGAIHFLAKDSLSKNICFLLNHRLKQTERNIAY